MIYELGPEMCVQCAGLVTNPPHPVLDTLTNQPNNHLRTYASFISIFTPHLGHGISLCAMSLVTLGSHLQHEGPVLSWLPSWAMVFDGK